MRRLGVGFLLLAAGAVSAQTPFGGDDPGTIPSARLTLTCQNAVAKAWGKAAQCIQKCHVLRASGKLADDTAENACELNNAGKSCLEKFTAAVSKAQAKDTTGGCNCVDASLSTGLSGLAESELDQFNGLAYCDTTSGTPFGGDDTGDLPVANSATAKCENAVANAWGKAWACILKCHTQRAIGKLADDSAEDVCENNNAGKSCLEKFTGGVTALGSSCPSCLTANIGVFNGVAEGVVDGSNGAIYCGPTTTTTTTTTLPNTCGLNPDGLTCGGTCSSGVVCSFSNTTGLCECPTASQCQHGLCGAGLCDTGPCPAGYGCTPLPDGGFGCFGGLCGSSDCSCPPGGGCAVQ